MATKKTKAPVTAPADPPKGYQTSAVSIPVSKGDDGAEFASAVARILIKPEVSAAAVIEKWQKDTHDVNLLAAELGRQVEAVNRGDLQRVEGMLIAQAHTLDNIFSNLARRAQGQEYLKQWEAYMRMAMKAQNQCRMTLETLATIKNPPVVFARQANINNGGQQQVNNGDARANANDSAQVRSGASAHAGKPEPDQTGLLEVSDGQWLDTTAPGKAGGVDPHLAPVGEVHRAAHR